MAKYTPQILSGQLVVLANTTSTLTLSGIAKPFLITEVNVSNTGAARSARLNIKPSDTQRTLSSIRIPDDILGRAGTPFNLDGGPGVEPGKAGLLVAAQNTVVVEIENTTGASITVDVALFGYEIT